MIENITLVVDKAEIETAIRQHFKSLVEIDLNDFMVDTTDLNKEQVTIFFKRVVREDQNEAYSDD
jgi:hypothetical protein